jgi:hypothetical protein
MNRITNNVLRITLQVRENVSSVIRYTKYEILKPEVSHG